MEFGVGDTDVAWGGEQLMEQGSPLLIGALVVRLQECNEIALGLIGNHLDNVGEVLAFRCQLDHGSFAEVSDFDALGNVAALLQEPCQVGTGLCAAACRTCPERS